MSFDGKVDSVIAQRNDAARKHHMSTKNLHISRTPSIIGSVPSHTVKDNNLTYRFSNNDEQQSLIESTFYTVEEEEDVKRNTNIAKKFVTQSHERPPWTPSNSSISYDKNFVRKGNQVEKKLPNRKEEMDPNSLGEGLLIVNGRKDIPPPLHHHHDHPHHRHRAKDQHQISSPSPSSGRRTYANDDDGIQYLENTLIEVPDSPPPAYEEYMTTQSFDTTHPSFLQRQVEEEQEELWRASQEIEQRRKLNDQKLKLLKESQRNTQPIGSEKPKGPKIDERISQKVQSKLKAGMYGTNPRTFFSRYDRDKSGSLNVKEFKRLVRATLKVPPTQLTDKDLNAFIEALDDDGSGDLDIAELSDFVLRGSATFNDNGGGGGGGGNEETAVVDGSGRQQGGGGVVGDFNQTQRTVHYEDEVRAMLEKDQFEREMAARQADIAATEQRIALEEAEIKQRIESIYLEEERRTMREEQEHYHRDHQQENGIYEDKNLTAVGKKKTSVKKKKKAKIDESVSKKVQSKLKAGMYGTNPRTFFSRYDRDKSGSLNVKEFKRLVRATLKVPPTQLTDKDLNAFIEALDDDGSGDLDIAELSDFVLRGSATFHDNGGNDEEDEEMSEGEIERRIEKMREARREGKKQKEHRFSILGEANKADHKDVTVPTPFMSMEMDELLRRHKIDERERRLFMDVEEEKLTMRRRAKRATTAEPNAAHLRLSQSTELMKQRREEAAAQAELDEMKRNQFKAVEYRPKNFEDWASMAENAEIERSKRLAKRTEETMSSFKAPSMVVREEIMKREKEVGKGIERPNSITKPEDRAKKYQSPEEVRASLSRSQKQWDKVVASKKEALERERSKRAAPQNPLADREAEYAQKAHDRQQRKREKEIAEKEAQREAEELKFKKAMNAPVPDRVRQTRASALKVETVRTAQLQLEQQAKRELARQEARLRRAKEAGEDLKPYLTTNPNRASSSKENYLEEPELSAKAKARQARVEMEEKVKAKRPSLMQRHDLLTAKDRARASTLRKVGGALRTVYGGGDGWLAAAMRDDVLDAEEVEFLRIANPSATAGGGGSYDDEDDDDEY